MNDPEIIEKLDEIKEELSGIKDEVRWNRVAFGCVLFGFIILGGGWIGCWDCFRAVLRMRHGDGCW